MRVRCEPNDLSIEGEAAGIELIDTHLNWSGA
jgi:hypothetical protein